jgi:hypothetical protein
MIQLIFNSAFSRKDRVLDPHYLGPVQKSYIPKSVREGISPENTRDIKAATLKLTDHFFDIP